MTRRLDQATYEDDPSVTVKLHGWNWPRAIMTAAIVLFGGGDLASNWASHKDTQAQFENRRAEEMAFHKDVLARLGKVELQLAILTQRFDDRPAQPAAFKAVAEK